MKALLGTTLLFLPTWALAAPRFNIENAIWSFLALVGLAIIFGLLFLVVEKAPWIKPEWKEGLKWILYLVAAVVTIFWILSWIRPYLPS